MYKKSLRVMSLSRLAGWRKVPGLMDENEQTDLVGRNQYNHTFATKQFANHGLYCRHV